MVIGSVTIRKMYAGIMRVALASALASSGSSAVADAISDLAPGQWYEAPNSTMRSVVMDPISRELRAAEGPGAVITSWSGGAYDTNSDRLIVWGGGHTAYAGNEVYAFDINTLTWSRLTNPSSLVDFDSNADTMPDGRPKSVHTYDHLEYVPPPTDKFFATGGSVYPQGSMMRTTWYFDFATNEWERLADIPGSYNYDVMAFNMVTAWDPVSGKVLVQGAYKNADFDPQSKEWRIHPGEMRPRAQPLGLTGALDPERRKLVAIGRGNAYVTDVDENGNLGVPQPIETTGANNIVEVDAPGLAYDPITKKMVAWGGGADIYTLDLDSLVWTKVAGSGSVSPPNPYDRMNYHGTFGRFRYVPSRNAFVVVTGIDDPVYFYKLTDASGNIGDPNAPAVNLSADNLVVQPQGTVTLTWAGRNISSCTATGAWSGTKATAGVESVGPITETSNFNLACDGPGGSVETTVKVTVDSGDGGGKAGSPPTLTLEASLPEVALNGSTVLNWVTTNADSCDASGGWSGSRPASGSEAVGPLLQNSEFSLTCTGPGGSVTDAVSINVTETAGPPEITLVAQSAESTVTLVWASSNTETCEASEGWLGPRPTFGEESVTLDGMQTYTLTCTGSQGSSSKSVTVDTTPPENPGGSGSDSGGSDSGGGSMALLAMVPVFLYALRRRKTALYAR